MATQTETPPSGQPIIAGSNARVTKVTTYVNQQLEKTRRQVKSTDLIGGLLTVIVIVLGFLILAAIWDAWIWPLTVAGRWICLAILLGSSGIYTLVAILPLVLKRINPDYAAHMIESAQPNFKNSVLNYVSLRKKPDSLNAAVFDAVSRQAATDLSTVPVDGTVDRSKLIRLGFALIGLTLFIVGYKILSPKDPLQTFGRVLAPAARIAQPALVQISEVTPGDAQIFFGEQLEISAIVRGSHSPNDVAVYYSSTDGQLTNQRIAMVPGDVPNRYRAVLSIAGAGIQQSLNYHVVARDGISPDFQVTVQANPTIAVESLVLTPPPYTKLPELVLSGQGNIDVIEGTKVMVHAVANLPIKTAYIELLRVLEPSATSNQGVADDSRFRVVRSIEMISEGTSATASFSALLNASRQKPLATHYQLRFVTTNGDRNLKPNLYPIKITPDLAPEITITNPALREVFVAENGSVAIDIEANDLDFEITSVAIHLDHQGLQRLGQNLELKAGNANQRVTARYLLKPSEHRLKAGDKAVFFATANDNRMAAEDATRPDPNISRTENYTLTVVAAEKRAAGDSQQSSSATGDPPQQGDTNKQDQQESGNNDPAENEDGTGKKSNSESGAGEPAAEDQQSADPEQSNAESGQPDSSESEAGQEDESSPGEPENNSAESPASGNSEPSPDSQSDSQSDANSEPTDAESKNEPNDQPGSGGSSPASDQSPAGIDDPAGTGSQQSPADSNSPPGNTENPAPGQKPSDSDENSNPSNNPSTDGSKDGSNDNGSPQGTERQDNNLTDGNQQPLDKDASPGEQFRRLEKVLDKQTGSKEPSPGSAENQPAPDSPDSAPKQDPASKQSKENADQSDNPAEGEPQGQSAAESGSKPSESGNSNSDQPKSEGADSKQSDSDSQPSDAQQSDPNSQQSDSKQGDSSNSSDSKNSDSDSKSSASSEKNDGSESPSPGEQKSEQSKQPSSKSGDKQGAESGDKKQPDAGSPADSDQNQSPQESPDADPEGSPSDPSSGGGQGSSNAPSGSPSPGESSSSSSSNATPSDATNESTSSTAKGGIGTGGSKLSSEQIEREKVNLAHSKKATDLILHKLDEQKYDPDPKLLEEMNWTQEDLNNFLRRWQDMKSAAEQGDLKAKARYEKSLKGLDLRPNADSRSVKQNKDKIQNLAEDNAVIQPPPELAPDFNATLRDLNRRQ